MSHFVLTVRVISVHTAGNCHIWCLVWPGGAAVPSEEKCLSDLTLLMFTAYVTFVKTHSTKAHSCSQQDLYNRRQSTDSSECNGLCKCKRNSKQCSCFVTARFLVLAKENQIALAGLRTTRLTKQTRYSSFPELLFQAITFTI